MNIAIPTSLAASCARTLERMHWLEALPELVEQIARRWSLSLGAPIDGYEVSCSWVAPARRSDGFNAILKIGMPHMEGEHEIAALRLLDGDPTVRLLDADDAHNAMLLERCEPGSPLRDLFQPDQDVVIAGLLKRFWRVPPDPHPFRPLTAMIDYWMVETQLAEHEWHDAGLVREGLTAFAELTSTSLSETLLATDLHAGNVLRAQREAWLVIDPKPFVGDRAFDATQHLLNCRSRLATDARTTIRRFADMLEVDYERVLLWTFARLAAEPRDDWDNEQTALARIVAFVN
jgi:streptomycin 6-kinase